jgi:tetratricopeptide (TPR) repeat protein
MLNRQTDPSKRFESELERALQLSGRQDYRAALQVYDESVEFAAAQHVKVPLKLLAQILRNMGYCYGETGQWNYAIESYRQCERVLMRDDAFIRELAGGLKLSVDFGSEDLRAQLVMLLNMLGKAQATTAQYPKAEETFRRAAGVAAEIKNPAMEGVVWGHLTTMLFDHDNYARAYETAQRMYAAYDKARDKDGLLEAQRYVAESALHAAEPEEALKHFKRLVDFEKSVRDTRLAQDQGRLADLQRRRAQGLPLLESQAGIREANVEARDVLSVIEYFNRAGEEAFRAGNLAAAGSAYAQCLYTLEQMPANEYFVAGVLFDLGRVATRARKAQPAVAFLEASTNVVRAQPRDARVARMLCRVSEALGEVGETQRGEILAKEAVQIYRKEGLTQPAQEAEQLRARLAGERRGGWLGGLVVPDDHAHEFVVRVDGQDVQRLKVAANGRMQWQNVPGATIPQDDDEHEAQWQVTAM